MTGSKFVFPAGYHQFHKDQVFNFQLNRWYSLGYARFEDMLEAGKKLSTFEGWKSEMLKMARKAQNHCQIGNIGLALEVMADWIDQKT